MDGIHDTASLHDTDEHQIEMHGMFITHRLLLLLLFFYCSQLILNISAFHICNLLLLIDIGYTFT